MQASIWTSAGPARMASRSSPRSAAAARGARGASWASPPSSSSHGGGPALAEERAPPRPSSVVAVPLVVVVVIAVLVALTLWPDAGEARRVVRVAGDVPDLLRKGADRTRERGRVGRVLGGVQRLRIGGRDELVRRDTFLDPPPQREHRVVLGVERHRRD